MTADVGREHVCKHLLDKTRRYDQLWWSLELYNII